MNTLTHTFKSFCHYNSAYPNPNPDPKPLGISYVRECIMQHIEGYHFG